MCVRESERSLCSPGWFPSSLCSSRLLSLSSSPSDLRFPPTPFPAPPQLSLIGRPSGACGTIRSGGGIHSALLDGQHYGVTHPHELCTPTSSFLQIPLPTPAMSGLGSPSPSRMELAPTPPQFWLLSVRPSLPAILGAEGREGVRVETSPEGTENTSTKVRGGVSSSPSRLPLRPSPSSSSRRRRGVCPPAAPKVSSSGGNVPLSGVR